VKAKTKPAAIVVSNCKAPSNRKVLVKKLQEYIGIDVFGKCGDYVCVEPCDENNKKTYKFYLSFENSLYADYVTEKLYKMLDGIIIPVVFNGADMSRFMPPKSYINANDFKTPKELAEYLNFLSDNPEEYVKYFWWKKHYKSQRLFKFTPHHLCSVCQKFNEPGFAAKKQFYSNLKEWYYGDGLKKPTIEF
jgi:alpha-1,3-fucosyltransferase